MICRAATLGVALIVAATTTATAEEGTKPNRFTIHDAVIVGTGSPSGDPNCGAHSTFSQ